MELVRVLWVGVFFFFTLILIFVWSKVAVIIKKIGVIMALIESTEKLKAQISASLEDFQEEPDLEEEEE